MRSIILAACVALPLLPVGAFAQSAPGPQTAAVETTAPAPAGPAAAAGGVTRDQFIQRAKDRAGQRAAARFDQMDANHDGVLDRDEIRTWRNEHPRRSAAPPSPPTVQ